MILVLVEPKEFLLAGCTADRNVCRLSGVREWRVYDAYVGICSIAASGTYVSVCEASEGSEGGGSVQYGKTGNI